MPSALSGVILFAFDTPPPIFCFLIVVRVSYSTTMIVSEKRHEADSEPQLAWDASCLGGMWWDATWLVRFISAVGSESITIKRNRTSVVSMEIKTPHDTCEVVSCENL